MIRGGAFFRLLLFASLSNAVPLQQRHIRSAPVNNTDHSMECVSDDVVYHRGDQVPSPGPCEQCHCDPPNVICTMIKCKVNSGCKTIQRANHCCPDYKCECEYNGKIYNNGERLDRPDDPCQVCYCKGGEVMCTSVTCYEREDCKPHFIPGQCCPKYDHCPVESRRFTGNSIRSVNSTAHSSKREMQPWLLTKAVSVQPKEKQQTEITLTIKEVQTPPSANNKYPQTIKIREILPTLGTSGVAIMTTPTVMNIDHVTESTTSKIHEDTLSEKLQQSEELQGFNAESKTDQILETEDLLTDDPPSNKRDQLKSTSENIMLENDDVTGSTLSIETNSGSTAINDKNGDIETSETLSELSTLSAYDVNKKVNESPEQEITPSYESKIYPFKSDSDSVNTTVISEISSTKKPLRYIKKDYLSTLSTQDPELDLTDETITEDTEAISQNIPTFDLVVDHHNSTDTPEMTLPTSETFVTFHPDIYSSDIHSETTEYNSYDGTSTDILKGGVYEELIKSIAQNVEIGLSGTNGSTTDATTSSEEDLHYTWSPYYEKNVTTDQQLNETVSTETPEPFSQTNLKVTQQSEDNQSISKSGTSSKEHEGYIEAHSYLTHSEENSKETEESSDEGLLKFEESSSKSETSLESSISNSDISGEKTESASELSGQENDLTIPPILQLNDQIQYLKIGGHHEETETTAEDIKSPVIHVDIFNINSKSASCNVSTHSNNENNNEGVKPDDNIQESVKVSHVMLTPSDLRVLAELLINDKTRSINGTFQSSQSNFSKRNTPSPVFNLDTNNLKSIQNKLNNLSTLASDMDLSNGSNEMNGSESDHVSSEIIDDTGMKLTNRSYTQLDSKEEKDKWSDEVLDKDVNSIILPISNVEVVDETSTNSTQPQTNISTNTNKLSVTTTSFTDSTIFTMEELSSTTVTYDTLSGEIKGVEAPTTETVSEENTQEPTEETTEQTGIPTVSFDDITSVSDSNGLETTEVSEEQTKNPRVEKLNYLQSSASTSSEENVTISDEILYEKSTDAYSSRRVDLPDNEYLVQQFPSTLDEREISKLKDFLKKRLSVP